VATRTLRPLLTATTLALLLAFPALGLAQDAAPAVDATCVPIRDAVGCLPTAPDSARVDLAEPTFSDPTTLTNPLFPINDLHSVLMLGHVDGRRFRTEVTLLPGIQMIEWNGRQIETRASQYAAYLDGRIQEVAIDYYAQADDGAVWYLGEDVADYEEGVIVSTDGTWRVGRAGAPPAMIMPGDPRVGDVFRPENIPGFVFEEVVVTRIGATFNGPHGPVSGAIVVSELHQDGTYSDKLFAPGYGEFRTGHLGEPEALALAVPTDALSGPPPGRAGNAVDRRRHHLRRGHVRRLGRGRGDDRRNVRRLGCVSGGRCAPHDRSPVGGRLCRACRSGRRSEFGRNPPGGHQRRPAQFRSAAPLRPPPPRSSSPASTCGRPNSSSMRQRTHRARSPAT